jgi:hypothetical protein
MNALLYVLRGVLAVVGKLLGHFLGSQRELDNRRRELRVQHLVDAWRNIVRAGVHAGLDAGHHAGLDESRGLEQALADIQLFGTPSQADHAARVARSLNEDPTRTSVIGELLESLRGDLRDELRLGRAEARLVRLGNEGVVPARTGPTFASM